MPIGVYVCHCGLNIAGVLNVEDLRSYAEKLPDVAVARDLQFSCSDIGQEQIQKDIAEYNLDRVVVAACSPRLHEPTFRRAISKAGLNPYMLEMANIREQCSWVHMDQPAMATEKAKDLIRMAVAKAALLRPLEPESIPVSKDVLVIGGGWPGSPLPWTWPMPGCMSFWWSGGPPSAATWPFSQMCFPQTTAPYACWGPRCPRSTTTQASPS